MQGVLACNYRILPQSLHTNMQFEESLVIFFFFLFRRYFEFQTIANNLFSCRYRISDFFLTIRSLTAHQFIHWFVF